MVPFQNVFVGEDLICPRRVYLFYFEDNFIVILVPVSATLATMDDFLSEDKVGLRSQYSSQTGVKTLNLINTIFV